MCTETFCLKATDDLVKKLKLEITNMKEENANLKRSQGGGGQTPCELEEPKGWAWKDMPRDTQR